MPPATQWAACSLPPVGLLAGGRREKQKLHVHAELHERRLDAEPVALSDRMHLYAPVSEY